MPPTEVCQAWCLSTEAGHSPFLIPTREKQGKSNESTHDADFRPDGGVKGFKQESSEGQRTAQATDYKNV